MQQIVSNRVLNLVCLGRTKADNLISSNFKLNILSSKDYIMTVNLIGYCFLKSRKLNNFIYFYFLLRFGINVIYIG